MTDTRRLQVMASGRNKDRFWVQPKRYWYPVAREGSVKRTPQRVVVFGIPYVLYRDSSGAPIAHIDRCPHRNVPLSGGRCGHDDTLECPYHGWRFRPDGSCAAIPGSTKPPSPHHRVDTYPTAVRYGIVWICPHLEGPVRDIATLPTFGANGYTSLIRQVWYPAGLFATVENALDVPHTSILHRGLFRNERRHRIKVTTRRYRDFAEAHYEGEPPPSGLVARALSLGGPRQLTVDHWDRFFCPNLLQVEYRLGSRVHFLVSGFCTPVSPERTELFAVVTVRTPYFKWLERALLALIEPLAMRVYRQDFEILRAQRETVETFGGERFLFAETDVLGTAITRLLKEAAQEEESVQRSAHPTDCDTMANGSDERGEQSELREVSQTELEA